MKDNKNVKTRITKVGADLSYASREAYNLLRTNISFAFPDVEGGKVVGVCSSRPQEGKSTTAINLAYSLAEAGHKVLLIDGDMRRPSVYETVGVDMEPGLSEMLSGKGKVEVHKEVLHPNMSVLTSGHIPPNPSELIGSHRMEALLEEYKTAYDYIIIDLPPVLAVSDPVAISKYLGGMILVVRHQRTRRRDIVESIRQLEYAGVKILGFVYNRMGSKAGKVKKGGYSYGNYHND